MSISDEEQEEKFIDGIFSVGRGGLSHLLLGDMKTADRRSETGYSVRAIHTGDAVLVRTDVEGVVRTCPALVGGISKANGKGGAANAAWLVNLFWFYRWSDVDPEVRAANANVEIAPDELLLSNDGIQEAAKFIRHPCRVHFLPTSAAGPAMRAGKQTQRRRL
jgi:hypothetical protein